MFALVGFEQAVQLGGESRNPQRDMPRAVIFSMLIGATIYLFLQVVFIGALPALALAHGWNHISFAGIFGPFAGLAKGLGLAWLAYILYADAIIAPVGSGLIYTTTTSRLTFGMTKNGHVPAVFERTTRSDVPVFGLIFAFLMGLFLFLPFPGWQNWSASSPRPPCSCMPARRWPSAPSVTRSPTPPAPTGCPGRRCWPRRPSSRPVSSSTGADGRWCGS